MEHHSRGFFAIDGDVLRVRDMEREALAAMNGLERTAYIGSTVDRAESILGDQRLRHALIDDVNHRSARKLRTMA
jgi:hypothetical protein